MAKYRSSGQYRDEEISTDKEISTKIREANICESYCIFLRFVDILLEFEDNITILLHLKRFASTQDSNFCKIYLFFVK